MIITSEAARIFFARDPRAIRRQCGALPVVGIGVPLPSIPSVLVDNRQGMRDVVEHLILHHGARRILFQQGDLDHPEVIERWQGYCDALARHGIPYDEALVIPYGGEEASGASLAAISAERLHALDAIVCIFAADALPLIDSLAARGLQVPDDIKVAGFGDYGALLCVPPLTTAQQPLARYGVLAVDLLAGHGAG